MSRSSSLDGPAVVPVGPYNGLKGSGTIIHGNQQHEYDVYFEFHNIDPALFAETSGTFVDDYFNMEANGFIPTGYHLREDAVLHAVTTVPQQLLPSYPVPVSGMHSPILPIASQMAAGHGRQDSLEPSPPPLLSRQASSTGTPAPATPQLSPAPPFFTPSPVSTPPSAQKPRKFPCRHCLMAKEDIKSRDRHEMETHARPPQNQKLLGWFRCACGKSFCHYRKSNYTRHVVNCKQHKWIHPTFVCQCCHEDVDKAAHETHYKTCRKGRGRVGRPLRTAPVGLGY